MLVGRLEFATARSSKSYSFLACDHWTCKLTRECTLATGWQEPLVRFSRALLGVCPALLCAAVLLATFTRSDHESTRDVRVPTFCRMALLHTRTHIGCHIFTRKHAPETLDMPSYTGPVQAARRFC